MQASSSWIVLTGTKYSREYIYDKCRHIFLSSDRYSYLVVRYWREFIRHRGKGAVSQPSVLRWAPPAYGIWQWNLRADVECAQRGGLSRGAGTDAQWRGRKASLLVHWGEYILCMYNASFVLDVLTSEASYLESNHKAECIPMLLPIGEFHREWASSSRGTMYMSLLHSGRVSSAAIRRSKWRLNARLNPQGLVNWSLYPEWFYFRVHSSTLSVLGLHLAQVCCASPQLSAVIWPLFGGMSQVLSATLFWTVWRSLIPQEKLQIQEPGCLCSAIYLTVSRSWNPIISRHWSLASPMHWSRASHNK